MTRYPDGLGVLMNGAFWVVVLFGLAAVVTHFAVMECMERGNWCDVIERGEGN